MICLDSLERKRKTTEYYNKPYPDFIYNIYGFIKYIIKTLFFYSFVFIPFLFVPSYITSSSMTPTFQTNDWVMSSVLSYGFKFSNLIPFKVTFQELIDNTFLSKNLFAYTKYQVGDPMSFTMPAVDKTSTYSKRIIANAEDKIQFINGILFINNEPCKLIYKGTYRLIENDEIIQGDLFEEEMPTGIKHDVMYLEGLGNGSGDYTEEFIIPKNYVACVGDNRHNSADFRNFFGATMKKDILGKVFLIFISNGNLTSLSITKLIKGMKWKRCIKRVL